MLPRHILRSQDAETPARPDDQFAARRRGRSSLAPAARPTNHPVGRAGRAPGRGRCRDPQANTPTRPQRIGQTGSEVSTTRSLVPRSRCSTNKDPPRWSSRPSPWARPLSRPPKATHANPTRRVGQIRRRGLHDAVARPSLPLLDQRSLPLVEQAEPLGEAVVEPPQANTPTRPRRVGQTGSEASTTRSLVPRSRCSTNDPLRWSSRPSPWARPSLPHPPQANTLNPTPVAVGADRLPKPRRRGRSSPSLPAARPTRADAPTWCPATAEP